MDARTLQEVARITDPVERARTLGDLLVQNRGLVTEVAKIRRQAIAEALDSGLTQEEIARRMGVSPGRVSQMRKGPAAKAPEPAAAPAPRVVVQRALPTEPAVRGSVSLFLVEAERQGIKAERRMLYVGLEPATEHVAACLHVEPGEEIVARRKLMTANGVPVRIATSFFRADLFAHTRIAESEFVKPSLQAALEALGFKFGRAEEVLTSRPPTPFEAETLELEVGEWIVQVLRASYSTEGTPVHTLETICAATRHIFPIGQPAETDEF